MEINGEDDDDYLYEENCYATGDYDVYWELD